MRDVFRPRREPARTLYDAFQAEATKRKSRTVEEWQDAEERAVWAAARDYAEQFGLVVPMMVDIRQAQQYASGSINYGSTWAYAVERHMTSLEPTEAEL